MSHLVQSVLNLVTLGIVGWERTECSRWVTCKVVVVLWCDQVTTAHVVVVVDVVRSVSRVVEDCPAGCRLLTVEVVSLTAVEDEFVVAVVEIWVFAVVVVAVIDVVETSSHDGEIVVGRNLVWEN